MEYLEWKESRRLERIKPNNIWKDILGYEGLYQINRLGQVKSFKNDDEKILKPGINGGSYYFVSLRKDGIQKNKRIHQLVAMAFFES